MKKVGWRLSTGISSIKLIVAGLISALLLMSVSACKPNAVSEGDQKTNEATATTVDNLNQADINTDPISSERLANQLWQQGLDRIRTLKKESSVLRNSINDLLAETDEKNLSAAQAQWKRVFLIYQELLPLLFIEHSSFSSSLDQWRFTLAAWPLQPGYLDSYDVYIQSGIVNDITLPLSSESLRKQHGLTDKEEVTLGLYAIDYLLWGDKKTSSPKRLRRQNKVPLAFEQAGLKVNELPNNRRRQLLKLQSEILSEDMDLLERQWREKGALSTLFTQLSSQDKLIAFHRGLSAHLNEISLLLAYEMSTQDSQKNNYPERFNKQRMQAVTKQLDAIESLYFSNISGHDSEDIISLAEALLSPDEKKNILESINVLRKTLKPIEGTQQQ